MSNNKLSLLFYSTGVATDELLAFSDSLKVYNAKIVSIKLSITKKHFFLITRLSNLLMITAALNKKFFKFIPLFFIFNNTRIPYHKSSFLNCGNEHTTVREVLNKFIGYNLSFTSSINILQLILYNIIKNKN